ncbi:MAG: hypothetical protein IH595_06070 [Bacteroidales bacterium]|nr:hypothetical protein [Bacteroidales bacterium]
MRFKTGFFLVVIFGVIMFTVTRCNTSPVSPSVVTYSYVNPILNPPDTFRVVYDLNLLGNREALITFQNSAVWHIEVQTQSLAKFGFINPSDNSLVYLDGNDTIGFRSDIEYSFILNNSNTDSLRGLYFVKFTKLPDIDYNTFVRKY